MKQIPSIRNNKFFKRALLCIYFVIFSLFVLALILDSYGAQFTNSSAVLRTVQTPTALIVPSNYMECYHDYSFPSTRSDNPTFFSDEDHPYEATSDVICQPGNPFEHRIDKAIEAYLTLQQLSKEASSAFMIINKPKWHLNNDPHAEPAKQARDEILQRELEPVQATVTTNTVILFTGGNGEAQNASWYAHTKYNIPKKILLEETKATSTFENAMYSFPILASHQPTTIGSGSPNHNGDLPKKGGSSPFRLHRREMQVVVVSDTYHLLRAKLLFEQFFGKGNVFVLASKSDLFDRIVWSCREVFAIAYDWYKGEFSSAALMKELTGK